jgi:hypothetical protein
MQLIAESEIDRIRRPALRQHCAGIAPALRRDCAGTTPVLRRYCAETARAPSPPSSRPDSGRLSPPVPLCGQAWLGCLTLLRSAVDAIGRRHRTARRGRADQCVDRGTARTRRCWWPAGLGCRWWSGSATRCRAVPAEIPATADARERACRSGRRRAARRARHGGRGTAAQHSERAARRARHGGRGTAAQHSERAAQRAQHTWLPGTATCGRKPGMSRS